MKVPKPITREDMYYSYIINGVGTLPKPITRKEMYLYYLCINGFGSGGTVTPEMIQAAVDNYLQEHPVESDYELAKNKPQINDSTLEGNKTFEELGMVPLSNTEIMQIIRKATS